MRVKNMTRAEQDAAGKEAMAEMSKTASHS
jgi:hypothetical protein